MLEIGAVEPFASTGIEDPLRIDSEFLLHSRFETFLSDESAFGPGKAQTIFFPVAEKHVADFLREMNANKIPVTVSGARTGIVGGAVPIRGALVSLEKMNRIVGVRWDDQTREWRVVAEPGIRLSEFQDRIAKKDLDNDLKNPPDPNWKDLQRFLSDPNGYFYAPDPTEETASLGGTIATDASGARTYFFGRTRAYVRALRVVLSTGDVLAIRRGMHSVDSSRVVKIKSLDGSIRNVLIPSYDQPDAKTTAGYFSRNNMDLIDLFIGSEGTLGVITLAEVALTIRSSQTAMFLAFFPSAEDAVGFVLHIRSRKFVESPLIIYSMEYLDSNSLNLLRKLKVDDGIGVGIQLPERGFSSAILCEFGYEDPTEAIQLLEEPLQNFGSSLNNTVSGLEERDKNHLRGLRHAVPEAINKIVARRKLEVPGLHKIGTDTAVPDDKLESMMRSYSRMLEEANLEHYVFGHIAENHLHVNMIPRNLRELHEAEKLAQELAKEAVALGGTVAAEHGIGKMKRNLLRIMLNDATIDQMRAIKRALDPNLILSPGNILPESGNSHDVERLGGNQDRASAQS